MTVTDLFEAQAGRTPHATAVLDGERALSYAELNARANRLARYLIEMGAGPERLVAIAVPREAEMVVAVLGVLTVSERQARAAVLDSLGQDAADITAFGPGHLDTLARVLIGNVAAGAAYRPGVFRGPLLFFTAAQDKTPESPSQDRWRPYVTGPIHNHDVPATHALVTRAQALTYIGPILAESGRAITARLFSLCLCVL